MSAPSTLIQRFNLAERLNHWVVAITFFLLTISGLALFHPAFFFLSALLGGGTWTRILHPVIGLLMFLSFLGLIARFWADNRITEADRQWLRQIGDVAAMREERLPAVGRFNAGQKILFRLMLATIFLLLVSGVMFWQPWFAPNFPVWSMRVAVVVHAASAFLLMAGIIIHVYAAIWVKDSIRGMVRGTVNIAWAKKHHMDWLQQNKGGSEQI